MNSKAHLEVVDPLGQLERLAAPLERLGPQPVGEVAHLLEHQVFLEELLLLIVDPLLEHLQLGGEVLRLGVSPLELAPPLRVLRRLVGVGAGSGSGLGFGSGSGLRLG